MTQDFHNDPLKKIFDDAKADVPATPADEWQKILKQTSAKPSTRLRFRKWSWILSPVMILALVAVLWDQPENPKVMAADTALLKLHYEPLEDEDLVGEDFLLLAESFSNL